MANSRDLDSAMFGGDVNALLLRIGKAIGFGRAQQILGDQWDELHDCAPRGQMGVTVDDRLPPIPKPAALRRSALPHGGYQMVPAYSVEELKAYGRAAASIGKEAKP